MSDSAIMETFEANIETVLANRGWSKKDLADAIGMDRSSLSKIIRGVHSPTLKVVEKIADACDIEVFELLQPRELVG